MLTGFMTQEGGNPLVIEQLAARAQAGCQDSFALLVEQYHRPIYNFLHQMTRNVHDAEDLTQETFIRACRYVGKYNSDYKFSTWLFTIARNCAVTHFRKQKRLEKTTFEDLDQSQVVADESEAASDQKEDVWLYARGLKPKQFEVLWLHYHEGFSVQETASIMGTNIVYVKVMLHRARHALAAKLKARKNSL